MARLREVVERNREIARLLGQGIDALRDPSPLGSVRRAAVLLVLVALAAGGLRYAMRQLLNSASRRVGFMRGPPP